MNEELFELLLTRVSRLIREQDNKAPKIIIKNELNLIIDACNRLIEKYAENEDK